MKRFDPERKKALVIGGSMSGLLAARILSDFYDEVTILERDDLSNEVENRRGVPQGWHAHGLLAGGSQVLEELFPDISTELAAAGAVTADVVKDGKWFFEGDCLVQVPSGTSGLLLSRPFLENAVRRRVRSLDRIRIIDNCAVRDLIVYGVCVKGVITDDKWLEADLVIDTSGRGSQSLKWLGSYGFPTPIEERVEIDIAYTTRYFRRRKSDLGGELFAVVNPSPENANSGVILAQEGDRWVVTLIGRFGVRPPEDMEGFTEFAKGLNAPFIYDVVRNAEPIGGACTMRFPASVRRRYEKLRQLPKGFLSFGDAVCSFNPAYGQGMSVAAMQARALREQLANSGEDLAKRFYRSASKVIDTPWTIAVGSDLRMPQVEGKRTAAGRPMNWYIGRLHKLGHYDGEAALAFLRVAQLLDEPSSLMHPKLTWRVLTANFSRRPDSLTSGFNATAGAERG